MERSEIIEMEYLDINGDKVTVKAEGWIARVFQHETDHLDGKLILDRTDRECRVEALEALQACQPTLQAPQDEQHIL